MSTRLHREGLRQPWKLAATSPEQTPTEGSVIPMHVRTRPGSSRPGDGHGSRLLVPLLTSLLALVAGAASGASAPVVDAFTATPESPAPGAVVTLRVEAHDPDCSGTCSSGCGTTVRYDLTRWSVSGGTLESTQNGTTSSPYTATASWRLPATEGLYTATVTLYDSGSFLCGGRQSRSATLDVLVCDGCPVVTSLTASPPMLLSGGRSELTCVASDPEGDPLSYSWDADRGTVTPGPGGTAVYTAGGPGIASVTCIASDPSGGSDREIAEVAVSDVRASRTIDAVLGTPQRLAADSLGSVFVVDQAAGGLSVLNLFTGELIYNLPLPRARSVAVDWDDRLLVGFVEGAWVVNRRGEVVRLLSSSGRLGDVSDVAVDLERRRYAVLRRGAATVAVFDEGGAQVASIGGPGDGLGQLKSPQGLAFTPEGDVVVGDSGHGMIKVFASDGSLRRSFGDLGGNAGEFVRLDDVAVNAAGVIFASDSFQDWVQSFNPDGSLREVLGGFGDEPGHFKTPTGLLPVDASDRLLVASLNSSSLQVYLTSDDPVHGGPSAEAQVAPASLAFEAPQLVGSSSAPRTVILSNVGGTPLGIGSTTTTGEFVHAHDCGPFVDPASSCTFQVGFTPQAPGLREGSLVIETRAPAGVLEVSLAGTGFVPPGIALSREALGFPDLGVGDTSAPEVVTLANTGTVNLQILGLAVSGDFLLASDCPSQLPGGAICALEVRFAPTSVGDHLLGEVVVASNALESPHRIQLDGRGIPGEHLLSITDLTVDEGDEGTREASFTVTLDRASSEEVTVDFATAAETAAEGEDFQAVSGTLVLAAGETTAAIPVPIVGDTVLEPREESFVVTLTNPVNATLDVGVALGTILDDEVCLGPELIANGGATLLTAGGELAGWTEVLGADWQARYAQPEPPCPDPPSCELAYFSAGTAVYAELAQEVDLSAYADRIGSGDQHFAFAASVRTADEVPGDSARIVVEYLDEQGSVLDAFDSGEIWSPLEWTPVSDLRRAPESTTAARVRLLATRYGEGDNDAYFGALTLRSLRAATVTVGDVWFYEQDAGASDAVFSVRLSCPFHQNVALTYSTLDGTAVEGEDYEAAAGELELRAGEDAAPVPVVVLGDEMDEAHERFWLRVELAADSEAVLLDPVGAGVIVNDDFCPLGAGYWKRYPERWPVDRLRIGDLVYAAEGLLDLLESKSKDASTALARELAATKLNLAVGSDPSVTPLVEQADSLLALYPPGTDGGDAWREARRLRDELETYNDGDCHDH